MNKEIGGYIELDTYRGEMLHEGAVSLNCGRNALAYLIRAREIKKIWLPLFICDSVPNVCEREGVSVETYSIGTDLMPPGDIRLADDEWLYIVNYYGQLSDEDILKLKSKYKRIIVDQAQSYYQIPVEGVDALYSCRKFFGVADGAFLYTDARLKEDLPQDESHGRMGFLLGRFERPAGEFYSEYAENNAFFEDEPVKLMSRLTDNLLHGIDYVETERIRKQNFDYLHDGLGHLNKLKIGHTGTFMYPLLVEGGADIRKKLQQKKIFIPLLWPSVLKDAEPGTTDHYLAENILPLPIDQRYGSKEMDVIIEAVKKEIG